MNPYSVHLHVHGSGPCWLEIYHGGKQVGPDRDYKARRSGMVGAHRLCRKLGLPSFDLHETRIINAGD